MFYVKNNKYILQKKDGRAVASDIRDPQFESSHQPENFSTVNFIEKTKIKKKTPRMSEFYKKPNVLNLRKIIPRPDSFQPFHGHSASNCDGNGWTKCFEIIR